MLTLYHRPKTRSTRMLWLLEELDVPYTIRKVTIRGSDGTGAPDPANPHPHGKVPVIENDGEIVYESPAIVLYLTDAFPKNGIGPRVGEKGRGAYLSWLAYYGDVIEPAFLSKFLNTPVPRGTAGWVVVEEAMAHVTNTLTKGPWLLGERFSGADVLYGSTFAMFGQSPLLPKSAAIDAYIQRCTARPAYVKGMAKDDG